MEVRELYELLTKSPSDVGEYWMDRSNAMKAKIAEVEEGKGEADLILRQLSELLDLACEYEQYNRPSVDFEKVTRVAMIRLRMPRPMIEKVFKVKTVSLYGAGLFAPVEGILMTSKFKQESGYEDCHRKHGKFDLSSVPEEIMKEYDFRLASPSGYGGLFIPKKTAMTHEMTSWKQIKFFDIMSAD